MQRNACILILSKFISNLDPLLRKITYNLSSIWLSMRTMLLAQSTWQRLTLERRGEGKKKNECKMASNLITPLETVPLKGYVECVPQDWFVSVWIRPSRDVPPSRGTCLTWAANDCQHLSTVDLEAQIVDRFLLVSLHLPRHFELWQPLVPGDLSGCVHLGARASPKQLDSKEDWIWGKGRHLSVTS